MVGKRGPILITC